VPAYQPGTPAYTVFKNGSLLTVTDDYAESSTTTLTITLPYLSTDVFVVLGIEFLGSLIPKSGSDVTVTYATLEEFNPSAGTGGDDTAAFTAAAATGKVIQLLPFKKYLLEPQLFTTTPTYNVAGIIGAPGSSIEPFGPLKFPAADYCLLHINVADGGIVQGFTVDAKVSQTTMHNMDPVTWDSSNYDTWYGSRGLVIRDST